MANHRMFSVRLMSSTRFLKMPQASQLLYFHLGLNADDDGVVEAYRVMKLVAAEKKDLDELAERGFIRILNEDLVTFITDWNENNRIRRDRRTESLYRDLLKSVMPDIVLIEPIPRADLRTDNQWTTNGQPMDGISKDSLGKDSLGKDSLGKDSLGVLCIAKPSLEDVREYAEAINTNADPDTFYRTMAARDWKNQSGEYIRNWKAYFNVWELDHAGKPNARNTRPAEQQEYDFDEIEKMLLEQQKRGERE